MKNIILFSGIFIFFFLTGCDSHKEEHKESEAHFLVTSPLKKDTSIVQEYVCQIHSINHIEIRSQERGYLQQFFVDEGQSVKKGQLLFEIMPKLYEAEYHKAQAEAHLAEIEYLNTKSLSDSNIVSLNELAMSKAKFDIANAELELAKVHLDFTKIKAPFDGIIDRFHLRLGSLVDEGELITNLSDNSKMWVYFNIPEAEYLDYMEQVHSDSLTKVEMLLANNKLFGYPGKVETIEADFNNETGNIPFRATFPNPKGLLRHGETGKIKMTVPLKNSLIIPQKTTFEILDKKYVFVIDENNKVKSRQITIIEEMPHIYIVQGGLIESDKILLEGLRLVRENEEIKFDFIDAQSAISNLDLYAE